VDTGKTMDTKLINWTLENINSPPKKNGPPMDMREEIAKIKALPPLPGSAMRIIDLISDPEADIAKLAAIIELDPLLTAQIIRWSSSALYGYRGKITTVHDAITRVLGFNFVLDLALGLAVLSPLKAPREGQLGTKMFWIHALSSSCLMRKLAAIRSVEPQFDQQEVFLAALMHNIGFPLWGHQFPEQFSYLNNLIIANPLLVTYKLETFTFGVNHAEIGAWLMGAWSMPRSIINTVYHHHNPNYRGENHQLNLLTFVSDCLLAQIGIGDSINQTIPEEVWNQLDLHPGICQEILDNLGEELEKIKQMAESLT
jgi:HD-like signal output (HDOD) protein